jgi:hypothetical protein
MLRNVSFFFAALAIFAAGDSWDKVRELKSGAELRIYKKGARQPVLAKLDKATEENLVIVLKDEQTAIEKDDIDRIDARPPQSGSRIVKETKTTTTSPEHTVAPHERARNSPSPGTSTSSSLTIGSRPDFETVYRRVPAPKK